MNTILLATVTVLATVVATICPLSGDGPAPKAAHTIVVLDDDGDVLHGMTLVISINGCADLLQVCRPDERGSIVVADRLQPALYHIEVRRGDDVVRTFDWNVERSYEIGPFIAIRLCNNGCVAIECQGNWVCRQAPTQQQLATTPPP